MRSAPKAAPDARENYIGTLRARVFLGPKAGPVATLRTEKPRTVTRIPPPIVATSVRGRICVAFGVLTEAFPDAPDFGVSDVVLTAWRLWPEVFGLAGHRTEAPCSSTVICKLSGEGSPVERGYLRRTGPRRYALTSLGRRWYSAHGVAALPVERVARATTGAEGTAR